MAIGFFLKPSIDRVSIQFEQFSHSKLNGKATFWGPLWVQKEKTNKFMSGDEEN